MAVLGRIADFKPSRHEVAGRAATAAFIALCLHLLFFQLMSIDKTVPFEVIEDFIAIELVTMPPMAQTVKPVETPPEIDEAPHPPAPKSRPKPEPKPSLAPPPAFEAPKILASSQQASADDVSNTVPPSEMGAQPTPLPPGPSADDRRVDEGLKSLAAELSCLNGFSVDCADIRKDVFEDFQMSETDKVYTKKYAHTGMPVEFYGMSERAIRAKLNVPNAGENGLYIPFTNIGIDGGIWDAIHGVNKGCEWKIGADPKTGRQAPIKDCPGYLPAAREDRDRRNKILRVNE